MTSDFYFTATCWFPGNVCVKSHSKHSAAPWARAANFVKKPPLIVNVTYLKLNGFNASMWVSWSPPDPKKSQLIDWCIQILQICVNKHEYDIHIKFEVYLQFWPIWPNVSHRGFINFFNLDCKILHIWFWLWPFAGPKAWRWLRGPHLSWLVPGQTVYDVQVKN